MNTLRATTNPNSDVVDPHEASSTQSLTATKPEPTNLKGELASRQERAAKTGSVKIPNTLCIQCDKKWPTSDGYFYRGRFICDKHVWILAENGEFYCG